MMAALCAYTGRCSFASVNNGAGIKFRSIAAGLCTPWAYSASISSRYCEKTRLSKLIAVRQTRGEPAPSPQKATLGLAALPSGNLDWPAQRVGKLVESE